MISLKINIQISKTKLKARNKIPQISEKKLLASSGLENEGDNLTTVENEVNSVDLVDDEIIELYNRMNNEITTA